MIDRHLAEAISLESETAVMALDFIGEAVLRTDPHDNVIYLNGIAETMTGWGSEVALGSPVGDVLRIIDGISRTAVPDSMATKVADPRTCMNCILVRTDGFEPGIEMTVGAPTTTTEA